MGSTGRHCGDDDYFKTGKSKERDWALAAFCKKQIFIWICQIMWGRTTQGWEGFANLILCWNSEGRGSSKEGSGCWWGIGLFTNATEVRGGLVEGGESRVGEDDGRYYSRGGWLRGRSTRVLKWIWVVVHISRWFDDFIVIDWLKIVIFKYTKINPNVAKKEPSLSPVGQQM